MLKINMGAHKGCRCRNGTILGISLILIFSSARMALAAENAVKQAETAVIVGYSVSFIDAENTNHLIFHTQTGKVLEGTSLNVSFPEQIIGSDGHIWKSAVQSPQIFELYGTGTEKIYIKYELLIGYRYDENILPDYVLYMPAFDLESILYIQGYPAGLPALHRQVPPALLSLPSLHS